MSPQPRTAIVTGAAGGMGRHLTARLHERGWNVAALDLVAPPLPEGTGGAETAGYTVDLADHALVAAVVHEVVERFGAVDAAVNLAGAFVPGPFVESTPEDWMRSISANLLTSMNLAHAVLPHWLERRAGSLVLTSSTAGEYGSIRPAAAYAAAKAGVIGFTKSLAREVGGAGIRVNAVSPGPVRTAMLGAVTSEQLQAGADRTLLGRLGEPEDIGDAVIFLAEDTASWITGTVLQVNGGSLL